jgi:hypothetical protein
MQGNNLEEEIASNTANLTPQEDDQDTEIPKEDEALTPLEGKTGETIHIHYFPDAIVILREDEEGTQEENVIDSTVAGTAATKHTNVSTEQTQPPEQEAKPLLTEKKKTRHALLTVSFYIFLILSGLILQSSLPFYSPTATVTIIPKSQQITVNGTLQLGRIVAPITLSQSQTVATTGKGHQDARNATGSITFYNGQLNSVSVPAGTVLTASNGVQVITEQDALIPKAWPPIEGQATIAAHTVTPGSLGNIPAKAINQACCALSVLAVNLAPFHGGQEKRDFQTVTKSDLDTTTETLTSGVAASMQAALQGQVQSGEALVTPSCTPTVSADHRVGEEAVTVKVTVSETCSTVAYDPLALKSQATQLLTMHASKQLSQGYSLLGDIQVTVKQATVTGAHTTLEFLCQGTWVYALDKASQAHMKTLIAGKTKQEALRLLASLPGIERIAMNWDESTKLPNTPSTIHIVILYGLV